MRLRFAPFAVLAAAFVIAPPAASAAPDREASLAEEGATYEWTSEVGTGTIYGSPVDDHAPACSPVFTCDQTLISTDRYGNLEVTIAGEGVNGQDTLKDIDLHVYVSNDRGAKGEVLMESTSANPDEAVVIDDLPAGYYLVYVDWYLGAGTYDGKVTLNAPSTPDPEEPPVFVPAPNEYAPVTPARSHTFATTADPEFAWTSAPGAGVSDVQEQVGCNAANCDYSLIKVDQPGVLSVSTIGSDTLVDGDLHLFYSNAEGGLGDEIISSTAFTPDESVATEVEAGYYLVRYQYTAAGTYDGKAQLSPLPPPEEEPTE